MYIQTFKYDQISVIAMKFQQYLTIGLGQNIESYHLALTSEPKKQY